MTAERLRETAALMRERATKAEASGDGEPWYPADEMHALIGAGSRNTADAEHIASWHPAVALAVADWLDATAAEHESDSGNPTVDAFFADLYTAPDVAALAVANAYLGGRP